MAGFVYIFSNPLYSRIKIGKSKKDPTIDRIKELNRETSNPEPFICEYYAFVGDENGLEQHIHKFFAEKRSRNNKEFFDVTVHDAINSIRKFSKMFGGLKYEDSFGRDALRENRNDAVSSSKAVNPQVQAQKLRLNTFADICLQVKDRHHLVQVYLELDNKTFSNKRQLAEKKSTLFSRRSRKSEIENFDCLIRQNFASQIFLGLYYRFWQKYVEEGYTPLDGFRTSLEEFRNLLRTTSDMEIIKNHVFPKSVNFYVGWIHQTKISWTDRAPPLPNLHENFHYKFYSILNQSKDMKIKYEGDFWNNEVVEFFIQNSHLDPDYCWEFKK